MYLLNIKIKNYGTIDSIDLSFDSTITPKPIVIVGKNGSGKTLLLSNIIDSLIEFKRSKYSELKEVSSSNYYKKGKKDYIKSGKNFSFVEINYTNNSKKLQYIDCSTYNRDIFLSEINTFSNNINIQDSQFEKYGFYKTTSSNIENEFEENIVLYFPVHRYYEPAWLTENHSLNFKFDENLIGKSKKNIIQTNVLREIETWILNLVLDKFLYENQTTQQQFYFLDSSSGNYHPIAINQHIGYIGKNSNTQNLINQLLLTLYKTKYKNLEYARIGVSNKESGRKISILIKEIGSNEVEVAPTFSHLSSGEALVLSIFCSLLKEYDSINNDGAKSLSEVKGIVVIDEIDINLHIELSKEVLPKLIKMFPNVQFILSSHSPFFLLGMKETFGNNYHLINMPNGEEIEEEDFEEVQKTYDIFTQGLNTIKENYNNLKNRLENIQKTIIITEGKTDWKHFKAALNFFHSKQKFENIDIEFLEYDDKTLKMSDSELNTHLTTRAKIKNQHKIIGIFDRDEGNGKKYSKNPFNNLGNNVYTLSIPTPFFRNYHEGISVEFLYKDEDLFKSCTKGRRLYQTSDFNSIGNLKTDNNIRIGNKGKVVDYLDPSKSKIIDNDVFHIDERSLALSKENFALNILEKKNGFESVNFDGFEKLFNIIDEIQKLPLE